MKSLVKRPRGVFALLYIALQYGLEKKGKRGAIKVSLVTLLVCFKTSQSGCVYYNIQ